MKASLAGDFVMTSLMPSATSWWAEWELYAKKLQAGLNASGAEPELRKLLADCVKAYEEHLCLSSIDEALKVISGYGCSAIEIAFMWMGRWRPTSAVVLVYSTMGIDHKKSNEELNVVNKDFINLNPISDKQLTGLGALQKYASQVESEISQQLAMIQMLLVEQNTVSALRLGETCSVEKSHVMEFQQLLDVKLKELQSLLQRADSLRLHTLRTLLDLLTPVQAAYCGVTAHELMAALRSFNSMFWNAEE